MKAVYRLKKDRQFNYTYKKGKSIACKNMVLVFVRTNSLTLKAGFSVSKKIGISVVRNKVKRRLKESFTKLIPYLKQEYNYIFIARKTIVDDDFKTISGSVKYLLKKADMFII